MHTESNPPWRTKCLSVQVQSKIGPSLKTESILEVLDLGLHDEAVEVRIEAVISMPVIVLWSGLDVLRHVFRRLDEIIPVGEVVGMEELAVELGCKVGSLPSQYLGLPLGVLNRAPHMWDGVEERVRRRLALWKRQYMSKGGRVTLIKSTLASMPIYQMSIFRMPKVVARRIEKVQRDFLWGGGHMEGKTHLVNWEVVCTDKARGGLGIRKLALLNKALLGKWIWRFASDKDNLWKQVIKMKYRQEEFGWKTKKARGREGQHNQILDRCVVFRDSVVHCFPHLFAMAVQRNSTVEEMWDQNSGRGNWNLNFLRDFNDWEMGLVGDFLQVLRGHKPSGVEDSVLWSKERRAHFRVKEAYNLLVRSDDTGFPSKSIWVTRVPTKVCFFAWEATWGRVLTLDRLQRRGLQLPNRCFLCGCEEESVNHILLHCTVVRVLWDIVFGLVDVKWVFPETVKDVLVSWRGSFVGNKRKKIWKAIPLCEEAFSLIGFLEWMAST
ncbi:putative ribonuclease H protein [Vitis vinifera]|uniref:Putative ribonuclease H protein n=1 Tax=Vitis vinifera TaxID=29760 RepID=A0A438KIQ4_VITVI|nr:putative ribonuclease H protein [Vitis vinifera]